MENKRIIEKIFVVAAGAVLVFGFQNCSNSMEFADSQKPANKSSSVVSQISPQDLSVVSTAPVSNVNVTNVAGGVNSGAQSSSSASSVPGASSNISIRFDNENSYAIMTPDSGEGFSGMSFYADSKVRLTLSAGDAKGVVVSYFADWKSSIPNSAESWTSLLGKSWEIDANSMSPGVYRFQFERKNGISSTMNVLINPATIRSPVLAYTYSSINVGGERTTNLWYPVVSGVTQTGSLTGLVLRRGTRSSAALQLNGQVLAGCKLISNTGITSDCMSWILSGSQGTVSDADIGNHQIQVSTNRGTFYYVVGVSGLQ